MGRAHLIAKLDGWAGDARIYKVVPPLPAHPEWDEDGAELEPVLYGCVILSKTVVGGLFGGPETYIFPADPHTWKTISMREMPGSVRGDVTHEEVLAELGYEIR